MEQTDTSPFELTSPMGADERRLFVESPGQSSRVVVLRRDNAVSVGRGDEADVVLDDRRASRVHARLRFDGRAVVVEDAGSSNGTFVGAHRVTEPTSLEPGMLMRVGSTTIALLPHDDDDSADDSASMHSHSVRAFNPVADDPRSKELFGLVARLAGSELAVLIEGEAGVGKEVVARAIHAQSTRAAGPFVVVSAAALSDANVEAELFGQERGVGGVDARRIGAFEAAHGGTLLLDDVNDLSPACQAAVLRVLVAGAVTRVGGARGTAVDVRLLSTSRRELSREVAEGRFREDLYFRLQGVRVKVAPLRERLGDVVGLSVRFLEQQEKPQALSQPLIERLRNYDWPGNVRELFTALDVALTVAGDGPLAPEHLPANVRPGSLFDELTPSSLRVRVDLTEKQAIVAALARNNGNQSRAARDLRISRRALIYMMERHGLKPPPRSQRSKDG